jgi:small multidrug resistance pump
MAPYYAALISAICVGIIGQIVLKFGAERSGDGLLAQFLNPVTILGLAVYFLAAVLYIVAIKRIPISIAYPTISISYAAVALLAHYLWNEPFGLAQVAGLLLITGGIVFLHH